jgi:hypothetical protein
MEKRSGHEGTDRTINLIRQTMFPTGNAILLLTKQMK